MEQALSKKPITLLVGLAITGLLFGCGGGGTTQLPALGGGTTQLAASANLQNLCTSPRSNTVDRTGTLDNEKAYLRSFINETYLWYQDVPTNLEPSNFTNAQTYFDALKTQQKTASGKNMDQFHWSQTTASYDQQSSGISEDYGIQWAAKSSSPPRNWLVAQVAPDSPAAKAGVVRGDKLTLVDDEDFINGSNVERLNAGVFPTSVAAHYLGFNNKPAISLTPAVINAVTVQNVKVISNANGRITGYFTFDSHIANSEKELIAAIKQLKDSKVTDLVIDLRYNGGGLLNIASKLAYMIAAGPTGTLGVTGSKTFERLLYNDKLTAQNLSMPFYSIDTDGKALPYLDLKQVTVLTTYGTASASESIINSLRGVNVDVVLIGESTRGKPYGFVPQNNCSWTYFAIQFKGVNAKGDGDYADGFTPTCAVADDFTHQRGDPAERQLAAALSYRANNNKCPAAASSAQMMRLGTEEGGYRLVQQPWQVMRILGAMPK